ncbi:hypothetical protein QBC44DRAFT_308537 [Cladorrhinum sp. PSN332]|nr:hypothetical protein QBC44DRAFT_308537 [Cladorrhinum sp. PSN332]
MTRNAYARDQLTPIGIRRGHRDGALRRQLPTRYVSTAGVVYYAAPGPRQIILMKIKQLLLKLHDDNNPRSRGRHHRDEGKGKIVCMDPSVSSQAKKNKKKKKNYLTEQPNPLFERHSILGVPKATAVCQCACDVCSALCDRPDEKFCQGCLNNTKCRAMNEDSQLPSSHAAQTDKCLDGQQSQLDLSRDAASLPSTPKSPGLPQPTTSSETATKPLTEDEFFDFERWSQEYDAKMQQ